MCFIASLSAEAYLAGNLGLYSGSSALLSPTSPSSSVPSLSQDSLMPSRHVDDRDRASPIASAAGSSQSSDSTSGNNSTSIGGSSNSIATSSSKRLDRQSRESLDGKSGGASSSQSRAHSHATLRTDGYGHQEKSSGGHREREASSGSHRRSIHVSPDPSSRRDSLEIKRESTDPDRALKDGPAKNSHPVATETKIKDEKTDKDTSRLDNSNKKQVENNRDSQQKDKLIAKDAENATGPLEKGSNCGDASGKTDSRQISSLSVNANDSDNVKTERISPVASASANKTTEVRSRASEKHKASVETNDQVKEKVETIDKSKEILNNNVESDTKTEKAQVDEARRKSTDSSSLRSEPIDIRPQRDIKESRSPEKMGSEVSMSRSSGSSAVPVEGSPVGQKDPSRVKREKSPVGSSGSSVGPAKVLTATSGGVVYAMYPAGQYLLYKFFFYLSLDKKNAHT